jgi:hypothetical protein
MKFEDVTVGPGERDTSGDRRTGTCAKLNQREFTIARKLGLGNVSLGIRVALDWAAPYVDAYEREKRTERDARDYARSQKTAAFRARKDKREKRAWMREQYGDSRIRKGYEV